MGGGGSLPHLRRYTPPPPPPHLLHPASLPPHDDGPSQVTAGQSYQIVVILRCWTPKFSAIKVRCACPGLLEANDAG